KLPVPALTIKLLRLVRADSGLVEALPTVTPLLADRLSAAPLPEVKLPFAPVMVRAPAALPIVSDCAAEMVPAVLFKVGVWILTLASVVVLPIVAVLVTLPAAVI